MTIEKRVRDGLKLESRADGEGSPKLIGYAAMFNVEADIGGYFREMIAPGAFAKAIGTADVRALFNHDSNLVLGRNKAGTLILTEDATGLQVEIDPPDTALARDLMVSMKRGDITQMSFGFVAKREEWDDTGPTPLRTILEADLMDVSIVTFPAYDDTQIAVRSLEKFREENRNAAPVIAARLRMKHGLIGRVAR